MRSSHARLVAPRRAVGLRVLARRHANDALEAARQMTLIAEPRVEGDARDRVAATEHLARSVHAYELEIHVRRQTIARAEPAAQVERAHAAQRRELHERD